MAMMPDAGKYIGKNWLYHLKSKSPPEPSQVVKEVGWWGRGRWAASTGGGRGQLLRVGDGWEGGGGVLGD